MKRIKLSNCKKYMLVDEDMVELLSKNKWRICTDGYAVKTKNFYVDGKRKQTLDYVHYIVMEKKSGYMVDHINQNKLDNRRENLRYCELRQNMYNRGLSKANTTGYKGIHWSKKDKKWRARIGFNWKRYDIGGFNSKEEAAKAYNEKALELYGEFAWLNPVK